jgi:CBS domain-containing protein
MNIASILATKGDKVVTVRAEQSIREALGLLAQHNIGALVVVDDGRRPIGILSERDIVRTAVKNEALFTLLVSQLMTRNLILGAPGDDLGAVGSTMVERRIRHLPVIDGGKLVGIVTIGDIVKAQRDQFQGEVDTLQTIVMEQGH